MGTSQTSREDQESESLQGTAKLKLSWIEYFMVIIDSYRQKNPLEVELSASRRGYKRYSKRHFLILKSLDSDNLLERLKQSMKALGRRRPSGQIPLKEEDEVLEAGRRSPSECLLSRKNNLSNGLLKG